MGVKFSASRFENEVDSLVRDFQRCIREVDDATLRLEELRKLSVSGEISQASHELIMNNLGEQLSLGVQEAFRLRESLELARARAKLELAKNSAGRSQRSGEAQTADLRYVRGFKDVVESEYWSEAGSGHMANSLNLQHWEGLVAKIESALSSLGVEKEAAITQQYLAVLTEGPRTGTAYQASEGALTMFQKRLRSVSERWVSIRHAKVERILDLELQASQIENQIKEVEARFSVGELSEPVFEHEVNGLKGNLMKLKREISEIRSEIDETDMKIFRASELLEESS